MDQARFLSKYISIIHRQTNRYYDRVLSPYGIGSGQYFFLLRIHENEGIRVLDLARRGHFDKGTTVKAIQKLEEHGYVRVVEDETDRRARRIYTTEQAGPVLEEILAARKIWHDSLTQGMSNKEINTLLSQLEKIADNSYVHVKQMEMDEIDSGATPGKP